jgi:tetratricopeptide (TPR) repeat protein
MKPVKDFLGKPAPAGYVAGAGRRGFTTRPDAAGEASLAGDDVASIYGGDDDERGLFATGSNDPEDLEADQVFSEIDRIMANRNKKKKQQHNGTVLQDSVVQPTDLFGDLKQGLAHVSVEEWASIPEAGDRRGKRMRKEKELERFTPLPDSIITGNSSIMGASAVGTVRGRMLASCLDQAASVKSASDKLSVNDQRADALVEDFQEGEQFDRARTLVKGMLRANPDHPDTWIAAIRLERAGARHKAALSLCKQGVSRLPECPELWLEYATTLQNRDEERRTVLLEAVSHHKQPISTDSKSSWEPVWLALVDGELTRVAKMAAIKRALKMIPTSSGLWSRVIGLAGDEDERRALLERACQRCPGHVEFWLQLGRVDKEYLRRALTLLPDCVDLWIEALKGSDCGSDELVKNMIDSCSITSIDSACLPDCPEADLVYKYILSRLDEAMLPPYCRHEHKSIRRCAVQLYLERNKVIDDFCREAISRDPMLAKLAVGVHPESTESWINLLSQTDSIAEASLFEQAVSAHPSCEPIWSLYLKRHFSVEMLRRAHEQCPDSADIQYQCLVSGVRNDVDHVASLFPLHEPTQLLFASDQEKLQAAIKRCPASAHLWSRACLHSFHTHGLAPFRALWEKARKAVGRGNELLWSVYLTLASPTQATLSLALRECPKSGLIFYQAIHLDQSLNASQKRSRLLSCTLRKTDPFVHLMTGELLAEEDGSCVRAAEHFQSALEGAGVYYADVYARCWLLMPEWRAEVERVFVGKRPTVSLKIPDRIDFGLDELVEKWAAI